MAKKTTPRARRSKGEGSVIRRDNGTYALVVDLGIDEKTGKRRRRWISGKTVAEVKRKATDLAAMGGGSIRPRAEGTVGEWMERWLKDAESTLTPNAHDLYAGSWRIHAAQHLGKVKLEDLDASHVEMLYQRMRAAGASPNLIDRVGRNLHRSIQVAIRRRVYTKINPFSLVDRPRVPVGKSRTLEPEEAQRFLQAASGDRFEALWILLLTSGLRLGEALALRWSDVDLMKGRISVYHSLSQVKGIPTLGSTKTPKSRRLVVIGTSTIKALEDRRAASIREDHGSEFVFSTTTGSALRRENLRRSHFAPICAKAKLGHFRIHDLRHTMTSLALLQGVSAKVTAERLGHSTTRLTQDRYSHLIGDLQATAADEIEAALFNKK